MASQCPLRIEIVRALILSLWLSISQVTINTYSKNKRKRTQSLAIQFVTTYIHLLDQTRRVNPLTKKKANKTVAITQVKEEYTLPLQIHTINPAKDIDDLPTRP